MRHRLVLTFTEARGRTVLASQYAQGALRVVRPFPVGDRVLVQILSVAPGLLGGDTYEVDIRLEPGAKVILLSQSALKVHRVLQGLGARQHIRITVARGAELEFYPGLTIPFPQADYVQRMDVEVEEGGRFGFLEVWAMGRVGRGEYVDFRKVSSRIRVALEGKPVYLDALELDPARVDPGGMGLLEGYRYFASGFWVWKDLPHPMCEESSELVLAVGATVKGHLYLRALAQNGLALDRRLWEIVESFRRIWGLLPLERGRYTSAWGFSP